MLEWFLILLAWLLLAFVIITPIVAIVFIFVLMRRTGALMRRVNELEQRQLQPAEPDIVVRARQPEEMPAVPQAEEGIVAAEVVEAIPATSQPAPDAPGINWELLIGRKALGWVAVVLVLFGSAFFLRYAYENQWVGPLGRVGVGLLVGAGLTLAGWRYYRRGWQIFSQMLSAAGIVVLFLAVYSAFGFYRLVPQQVAAGFLLVVIVEAALLAVLYNAPSLAWTSLLGGLLIPLLMQSETDQYQALFIYLAMLDLGIVVLAGWRHWWGLGTAALLGTHGQFWLWHLQHYHPEKLAWAIGFQLVIYGLFVAHSLTTHVFRSRRATWEDLARLLLNAFLWFAAAFVLLREDYRDWMGLLAVSMAMIYVILGRVALGRRPDDSRQLLTSLAAAVGFIGLTFPIQADAQWIALGWAAEAVALWWFGLRVNAGALRAMAASLITVAVGRLLLIDTLTRDIAESYIPVLNEYALPALGVTACLLGAVAVTGRFASGLQRAERVLIGIAGVAGVLLLWFVLSVDLHSFFDAKTLADPDKTDRWHLFGQMALSALWAVYAVFVLSVGFVRRFAPLRWTALFIFALTIGKVFFYDMAGLKEFYRILAFFIVAILLGIAGWAYQRIQVERQPTEVEP
ncbi:MAG: DUF2339 domain-containing protein [Planctomycetes bacterium]|nr:DUF2339 domain-containing protein [Planctomycetota bacterium]